MRTLRSLRLRGAAALALGFVVATSIAAAPARRAARPPAQAPAKHMLFRVRGASGATVFLLGSVHLLTPEAGQLPPVVDSAFARAKSVTFETSLDSLQMRATELLALARNASGVTLRSALTPPGAAKADSILKGYGLSLDQLGQFKPWFVSLLMTQVVMRKAGFQAQYGVDAQLNARAHAANKPVGELEPVDFQLHLFDSLTPAEQEQMLVAGSPPDSSAAHMVQIKDAWLTGNVAALDSTLNKSLSEAPGLFAKLVVERNERWVPQIEAMLAGKDDALVVVGAAHLVGKHGVVELLRAKGYTVDQL